jgi:hypothetical protein
MDREDDVAFRGEHDAEAPEPGTLFISSPTSISARTESGTADQS